MAKELFAGQRKNKYKILISKEAISRKNIAPLLKEHKKTLIISDDGVPQKIVKKVTAACKPSTKVFEIILQQGEKAKSIQNFQKILNFLAESNFDRTDLIIAVGGGVVGDISGYVASSYLRGIPFIQIPTTLLAQVDSSVGGKTAINISAGKNLVGAFYNPKGVIIDTSVLKTLSNREFKAGLAEVIKYALIKNKSLFSLLKRHPKEILLMHHKIIEEIIFASIHTKAQIVTQDEKENGIRAILNFGHTFGHAIEAHGKYKKILHGEAVAKGMKIASKISYLESLISEKDHKKVIALLEMFEFDLSLNQYNYEELKPYILRDKKIKAGRLNLVLLNQLSNATVTSAFDTKNLKKAMQD
ncbi:MAG: 3-dehydroquinate synthase [SAR86 cluster bacterium]|jgi:3-dehydroquinate synthase|nr:3-dehydroquinate synthase [SAR86 cluster bacterium]MDA8709746.1 3-dehydroquinate synthase [Gammaproteobacteria bacterium]MBL6822457.1 3-dehydroquinate synthase [SAR86 cluster bacterium]MDA8798713.1 3-dehydroquinate synthase [Gammaproteobacteria bacterium]MDB2370614.1 3-dehydroquinate synthase [Gammaproteobacteria bacterium]